MKRILIVLLAVLLSCNALTKEEIVAGEFLANVNKQIAQRTNADIEATFLYSSNITVENEKNKNEVSAQLANYMKLVAEDIKHFNWKSYESADLRRQFSKLANLGYAALPEQDYAAFVEIVSSMESNYAKVRVCNYKDKSQCDFNLDPEIESVISSSQDPEELEYYWKEFYDKAGTPLRSSFEKYVDYSNQAAKLNGFKSGAESWLNKYEDPTFESQLETIFERLRPLYNQIHGYVRFKLNKHYGDEVVSKNGPIPMHLLGNMWAQTWGNIGSIVAPFPDKTTIDVSEEMVKQGITPVKMFEMGNEFFTSMGLKSVTQTFWEKSILEKPADGRDLVCQASAWDFFIVDDVRIKQCTKVTQSDLAVVHHELGHIQYYLQYQHLPYCYRDGANPGFHEAVGDVLALSVSTPRHLQTIGLLKDYVQDQESRINQLFLTALDKIVFLPFAFTIDKYRWALFRDEIPKSNWNCAFWKLRTEYSGIEPTVVRTEADFDPPAKYHVAASVEYLRYLVSFIIQFQFYKSACVKAGQYDPTNPEYPLDNCDIYGSKAAGDALHNMLSLGASKPWPDVLEAFNGERTMTADAIAEYFEPLRLWLEAENLKNNVPIGWTPSNKCVS